MGNDQRCETCQYFDIEPDENWGECHLNPRVYISETGQRDEWADPSSVYNWSYPLQFVEDCCSQFKSNEAAALPVLAAAPPQEAKSEFANPSDYLNPDDAHLGRVLDLLKNRNKCGPTGWGKIKRLLLTMRGYQKWDRRVTVKELRNAWLAVLPLLNDEQREKLYKPAAWATVDGSIVIPDVLCRKL